MIYRRWSLLTGPPAILGAIVVPIIVANIIFPDHVPFSKTEEMKADTLPSAK